MNLLHLKFGHLFDLSYSLEINREKYFNFSKISSFLNVQKKSKGDKFHTLSTNLINFLGKPLYYFGGKNSTWNNK